MREIKFRAWDKQEGCWLDKNHAFDYAAKETKLIYCDIEGVAVGNDTVYLLDECGNWEYLSRDRFELMQFTGLHDKNGKEVWEKDIFVTENNCIGVIKYEDGCFITEIPPSERFDHERVDPLYYAVNMGIEIIGNIYENLNYVRNR